MVSIDPWVDELLASMGISAPVSGGQAQFQATGEHALRALLGLIAGARQSLRVATFLLGQDSQAERIISALCDASARGVNVRLLLDAMGCLRVTLRQYSQLTLAGIQVRRYMPLLHNPAHGRFNLRNHRKLMIVDDQTVWAGGRNLAGEYFMGLAEEPPWLDLSFSIDGPLAGQAIEMFEKDWEAGQQLPARYRRRIARHRGAMLARMVEPMAGIADMPEQLIACMLERNSGQAFPQPASADDLSSIEDGCHHTAMQQTPSRPDEPECVQERLPALITQLLPSGPNLFDDTLYALILTATFHAERRLMAVTPYFVPDEALMTALLMAARRGVQISLLVPAKSNHLLADVARMRALRQLAQIGARVYLYPTMVHAKVVIVDEAIALAGSLNLDSRSFFLNYEMMVAFYRKTEIDWLSRWLASHIERSNLYHFQPSTWYGDLLEGMVRTIAYQL